MNFHKCLLKFCKINFCFTERKKFTWANNTIEQVSDSSIDHLYKLEDSKPWDGERKIWNEKQP